jgi:hypothetical protein
VSAMMMFPVNENTNGYILTLEVEPRETGHWDDILNQETK